MTQSDFLLSMPLPEDILKRKWAGDLAGAIETIDRRLLTDLPQPLHDRLVLEREIIVRLPTQYPYDRERALAKMQEAIPDFTSEELDSLDLNGKVDFIYVNGEKRYFIRFHKTLLKSPDLLSRMGETPSAQSPWLDPLIEAIKQNGRLTARIALSAELYVTDDAFIQGETYRAHLPVPANAPQTGDIAISYKTFAPKSIDSADAPQRTAFFEETLDQNASFGVDYSFTQTIRYADLDKPAPKEPLYPAAPLPTEADLAEEGACIRFTPYLRWLCADITRSCSSPTQSVRAIYDFVTKRVTYAFVRDYFQIPDLAEYAAVNLRGDCGIQVILFISLCRIAGIPARWQSGLVVAKDYVGSHDWAQFYLAGWGWLFADCSFGGSAHRAGNEARRLFYLGNLEPLRVVFNSHIQKPLSPLKQYPRIDPYDNQSGEIECSQKGFNGREADCDITLISLVYE